MKAKNLLKKAFLLLALMGGANSAWGQDMELKFTSSDAVSDATTSKVYCNYFTVGASDSKKISIASSNKTIDGKSFTYVLKFGGTGDASGRYVKFSVTGPCTIKAYGASSSSGTERCMVLASGSVGGTILVEEMCKNSGTPSAQSYSYTGSAADLYIYSSNSGYNLYGIDVTYPAKTATSEVLKSSSAVKVGESTLTKDAATNGYSVDGTTITLSNDISAVSTPTNVALVKTITYDDESTKDEDVDVTFDGTITDGYYIGTASIGLIGSVINYTVKVKKNVSPTIELSETSGTISMTNSYTVIGSTTVTLTGGNLTNGEYTVTADQAGTTISPSSFTVADGSVDQEFTITTSGSSAATTVFTFGTSDMGVAAPTFTLTYEPVAKRSLSQADVSTATTWDWANAGSNSIQLTDGTNPTKSEEFLLSDLQEIPNSVAFNSQALKVICEWPNRGNNSYIQVNSIKFNATVPGTVQVWFSNTGSRTDEPAQRRYLYVNNTNSDVYSIGTTMTETAPMPVSAGEVVINAYTGTEVATMVRINKIIFTPVTSVSITPANNWSTYVTPYALDFSGVAGLKAYVATAAAAGKVTLEPVGAVPAGTPLMLVGTASTEYTVPVIAPVSAPETNLFEAGDGTTEFDDESTTSYDYILFTDGKFYRIETGTTVPVGKAYLHCTSNPTAPLARELRISFGDNITGIEQIDNGQLTIDNSQDGKFIENGKLVIVKNGVKYNAAGAKLY